MENNSPVASYFGAIVDTEPPYITRRARSDDLDDPLDDLFNRAFSSVFGVCFASLWKTQNASFGPLLYLEPQTEILGAPDLYINRGSTINLTCVVLQSPEPPAYIFWNHNDAIINYDSTRGGVSVVTEKGDSTTSFLLVQEAKPSDSGRYTCNPSNAQPKSITVHESIPRQCSTAVRRSSRGSTPSYSVSVSCFTNCSKPPRALPQRQPGTFEPEPRFSSCHDRIGAFHGEFQGKFRGERSGSLTRDEEAERRMQSKPKTSPRCAGKREDRPTSKDRSAPSRSSRRGVLVTGASMLPRCGAIAVIGQEEPTDRVARKARGIA
ncbi:hypothetical protein KM043_005118 [Ampulex compressa]|nr:hypothetical protein KM043_005118 [Ampulex compressa]